MRRVVRVMHQDFDSSVETWETKAIFKEHTRLRKGDAMWAVGCTTTDQRFQWINEGTGLWGPKHSKYPIIAGYYTGKSSAKNLAFPSVFKSKTRPGRIKARGGMSGGPMVRVPMVMHPGIKPRDITGMIQRKRGPWFQKEMLAVFRAAAAASKQGA